MQIQNLKVDGIHCQNCASKLTAILKGLQGIKSVEVEVVKNEGYGNVKIEFDLPANAKIIQDEILDSGYNLLE